MKEDERQWPDRGNFIGRSLSGGRITPLCISQSLETGIERNRNHARTGQEWRSSAQSATLAGIRGTTYTDHIELCRGAQTVRISINSLHFRDKSAPLPRYFRGLAYRGSQTRHPEENE
jgi:hypothetical protein